MATFTFDQLEAFAMVVEQGSFSAAARKLKKDRSTVHQLVSFLEIDWGVELFNREGKPQNCLQMRRVCISTRHYCWNNV